MFKTMIKLSWIMFIILYLGLSVLDSVRPGLKSKGLDEESPAAQKGT